MILELLETMHPLTWLEGTWKGKGSGGFPTMEDFEYEDQMDFRIIKNAYYDEPLIHFEEIAWITTKGEKSFKHWESGYYKPTPRGQIQFYVCHNTGRIEVTYGKFQFADIKSRTFEITFESDFIRNDEGTKIALTSTRKLSFEKDCLSYSHAMSTEDVNNNTHHLKAELKRLS